MDDRVLNVAEMDSDNNDNDDDDDIMVGDVESESHDNNDDDDDNDDDSSCGSVNEEIISFIDKFIRIVLFIKATTTKNSTMHLIRIGV